MLNQFKKILFTSSIATLSFLSLSASASNITPERELLRIPNAAHLPLEEDKLNITEFFSYYCIHCYRLSTPMSQFIEENKDKINYKQVHVHFAQNMEPAILMHYTLDRMGYMPSMSSKIFQAFQNNPKIFTDKVEREKFLNSHDIDVNQYNEYASSFAIRIDMDNAKQIMRDYQINSTPTIIVNNRYIHSPAINKGYQQTIDALKFYLPEDREVVVESDETLTEEAENEPDSKD